MTETGVTVSSVTTEVTDSINFMREMKIADEITLRLLDHLLRSPPSSELLHILLDEKHQSVAVALFKATQQIHEPKLLGFLLRFLADLVLTCNELGKCFVVPKAKEVFGKDPAESFLYFVTVHCTERGIADPALFLAATVLRHGSLEESEGELRRFFTHIAQLLSTNRLEVSSISFAVHGCALVARRKELRKYFFEYKIVKYLPRLLSDVVSTDSASVVQLIYETLLLSWLLSYEFRGVVELQEGRMIQHAHRVLQRLQKEKCIRVALMMLWNMVEMERRYNIYVANSSTMVEVHDFFELRRSNANKGPAFIAEMVGIGMLKTLNHLSRRKFGDEDIGTFLNDLRNALENSMEKLTSFSEYRGEVLSGSLEWTPVHTSTKFWKENIMQFESDNFEVLVMLGNILLTSHDDLSLAVACYDIGEIVRYHPTGRALLLLPQLDGVKERVMALMSHENPEVAKNALLAVQKIMVQRWEYIQE